MSTDQEYKGCIVLPFINRKIIRDAGRGDSKVHRAGVRQSSAWALHEDQATLTIIAASSTDLTPRLSPVDLFPDSEAALCPLFADTPLETPSTPRLPPVDALPDSEAALYPIFTDTGYLTPSSPRISPADLWPDGELRPLFADSAPQIPSSPRLSPAHLLPNAEATLYAISADTGCLAPSTPKLSPADLIPDSEAALYPLFADTPHETPSTPRLPPVDLLPDSEAALYPLFTNTIHQTPSTPRLSPADLLPDSEAALYPNFTKTGPLTPSTLPEPEPYSYATLTLLRPATYVSDESVDYAGSTDIPQVYACLNQVPYNEPLSPNPCSRLSPSQQQKTKHVKEEIDTKELAERISKEMRKHSISQGLFAQKVLCRSQGTLSEILKKPKPWYKLKSRKETFRTLLKWLKDPEFRRKTGLGIEEHDDQT